MNSKQCSGYEPVAGLSRRQLLSRMGMGLGSIALADLVAGQSSADDRTHFKPRAKRVIYLFQSGAPSQMDLFDYKPVLNQKHGTQLPEEVRKGQRLTAMSGNQASLPLAGTPFKFQQHGDGGTWISEILPHTAGIANDICVIKSMYTEAINHGPAVTYLQTGSQFPGRPSMGAWLKYGLGSENENLPAFVVMVSKNKGGQPLVSRLWGSGFLPSTFQGVRFRSGSDPVLYLKNPAGIDSRSRQLMLARLRELHQLDLDKSADPQLESRIQQYELAYRMQRSVPEAVNLAGETAATQKLYGIDNKTTAVYGRRLLAARRLAERGVRYSLVYLSDYGEWDSHNKLQELHARSCARVDRPIAGLLKDLKQRGLLDSTLVVFGTEFGRTPGAQVTGRDHHPQGFTCWLAGGGIQGGITHGATDELGFYAVEHPHYVTDIHATVLRQLGLDSHQLELPGRKRIDIHRGRPIQEIIA